MLEPLPDPRARRTRHAVLEAFFALLHEHRYDAIRIADIVERAGIGRSTFYEHFQSRDAVLVAALDPILLMLATAASGRGARSYVEETLAHLWERRGMARTVLAPAGAAIVQRRLARRIFPHVERRCGTAPLSELRAVGIAAAQIAILRGWLAGEVPSPVADVAEALVACARLGEP